MVFVPVTGGSTAEYFDGVTPRDYSQDTLTSAGAGSGSGSGSGAPGTYTLTTTDGSKVVFHDFSGTQPVAERGQMISMTDPAGDVTAVTSVNTDGTPAEVQRTSTTGGVTTTESYLYAYSGSGSTARLTGVTLRRKVGSGSWSTVRTSAYTYTADGDVESAVVEDAGGNVLDQSYYRYYSTFSAAGYPGGLEYAVTGASYARLKAWCDANSTTVAAASDAQVAVFADSFFTYDLGRRVTTYTRQGTGCSSCAGGLGTTTFAYTNSAFADGYNAWRTKTVATQADGNTEAVYTNFVGQPMLDVYTDTSTGQQWCTFYQYDTKGRLVLQAGPAAVASYSETTPDLVTLNSTGLVQTTTYYTSTTANDTTAGGVAGYVYQTFVQRGAGGTPVLQSTTDYIRRVAGGTTVYLVAHQTQYRNTNGTGGETTSYAYTFFSGSLQPQQVTTTLPAVTTGENGSGSATSTVQVFDSRGRVIWQKDAAGFLTYTQYDDVTGAITKTIQDVDTTQTGTFSNLPSGWTTPTGGGLHLTTTDTVDALGRVTAETSPGGNVTYTVYNDPAHEVLVYPGWDSTHLVPTGPTQVYREDWSNGYTESLTMSATPTTSGGVPTGQEAIANVQSLSRNVLNAAGQVVDSDQYISLAGTSYSQSSVTLGTSGTNYNRTQYSYDALGNQNKVVDPAGTITRTVFDGQARPVSTWVGTDDTPGSGYWSPTNNTAPSNMVEISETEYDAGGVGDGLVTKVTQHPGGGIADRVTAMSYDWRDRQVATKQGVETSESTSVNRPITYQVMDNLGDVTETDQYDGDGLSITTDANNDGVPDQPSSSALRAKSMAAYDELGRAYQEKAFSVDPTSGSMSTNALTTNHWFDSRGNEIKTNLPGGLVDKTGYDGAGRPTVEYVTDGGGDSGYSDASTVTGDAVLEQTELTYDADGNTILTTTRERFHDQTGTGALGTPTSGVLARVSYQAAYFDKADRLTDSVDVGTNGGTAYTRPATVPSRSDTVLVSSTGYNAAGLAETSTDPAGLVGKTYYDMAGQVLKSVDDYTTGTVGDNHDKTVELTYNGNGQNVNTSADLTGGGQETTANVYGVGSTGTLFSNDLVTAVEYPDPTSGNPSSTSKDTYTYNQLGQVLTETDRNGNVHTYTYDVLGRVTSDTVTTLGTGVDGTVRRIDTAYDGQGNPYLVTSYDSVSGGNVVNQVQRAYNGLGQLIQEWQATSGSVNTSTTPSVQYGYSFAPSGSTDHSRLTSITYPNGRVISYNYATGLDDTISRLTSISDTGTTLESYSYLGLGTVVKRAHPQTGVDLTYISTNGSTGDAGDQYTGLDRFGRVVDQNWYNSSTSTSADDRQYGYDRDSNRLYMKNTVSTSNSELYAYDALNQLTSFQRGTLNSTNNGLTGSASRSQSWTTDAVGNFATQVTNGTTQSRLANKQNEITSISGATTPTYDATGNTTGDDTGKQFVYDAWNRLVVVKNSGGSTLATYRYDALSRRVRETRGSTTTDLYYSDEWQLLEERVGGTPYESYVWSPVYVDALITRDRSTQGNGILDERLYALHDANFNVVALLNTSGTVVERYAYDSYGGFVVLDGSWGARTSSSYLWVYQYQGGRWDSDAGTYIFRNRVYSPTLGRWLQLDPIGFWGGDTNLLRAELNNPINRLDPLGLDVDVFWFEGFNPLGIQQGKHLENFIIANLKKEAALANTKFIEMPGGGARASAQNSAIKIYDAATTPSQAQIAQCKPPYDRIVLIGYSYGGSLAAQVAELLTNGFTARVNRKNVRSRPITLDAVFTIDPVPTNPALPMDPVNIPPGGVGQWTNWWQNSGKPVVGPPGLPLFPIPGNPIWKKPPAEQGGIGPGWMPRPSGLGPGIDNVYYPDLSHVELVQDPRVYAKIRDTLVELDRSPWRRSPFAGGSSFNLW
jgi:RHS repeat-associated protein